jgi:hypothetical protein
MRRGWTRLCRLRKSLVQDFSSSRQQTSCVLLNFEDCTPPPTTCTRRNTQSKHTAATGQFSVAPSSEGNADNLVAVFEIALTEVLTRRRFCHSLTVDTRNCDETDPESGLHASLGISCLRCRHPISSEKYFDSQPCT